MPVCAQAPETPVDAPAPASDWPKPVKDNRIFTFVTLDQFEGRTNGPNTSFRWDGQGWIGTDFNKLWIKSEGIVATASPAMETTRFCTTGRLHTYVTSIGRQVRVSISIPVQLGHCRDRRAGTRALLLQF